MTGMSDPTRPQNITVDRAAGVMRVTWQDGHESVYALRWLRANCPCVECKGGHGSMGTPANLDLMRNPPPSDVFIEKIVLVGSYALQFQWSDGHDTGIYTWAYLRGCDPES